MEAGSVSIRLKLLTVLTAFGVALTWGIGSAPSEAAVTGEITFLEGQTYTAPLSVAPTANRDAFEVVQYTPVIWPVNPATEVSSGFGWRTRPYSGDHLGVDLTPGGGTPVQVVASGTVSFAGCSGGLGCHVVVEHSIDGVATQTTYGHMQYDSILVSQGQQVTWGQQIGLVGDTGASTGNHLHFEVHVNGEPVDPYAWIVVHATEDW